MGSTHHNPNGDVWEMIADVGDRIGLLLDLDVTTMAAYRNDTRLGACPVADQAMSGSYSPYCWAAGLGAQGQSAQLESAPVPADPTSEDSLPAEPGEADAVQELSEDGCSV